MNHTDLLQPLALFAPSPTNPRSRITDSEIKGLAAAIEPHGVLQPILARPWPDRRDGEPLYEIVAGHRRWAATNHLEAAGRNPHAGRIPALITERSDAEVLTMQLVENIAREDLHPLDEAAHYRRMRDAATGALSVEEIAAVGKVSVSRVYERLSLLNLVPAARQAFLAEQLTLKTALQVARLPAEHQAEVTVHLADWGGEPMTPKAAAAFIRDRFMLRLAQAPFDPTDATLLPAAGACGACPKRTGANPQLFGDITDADTCTDTTCFGHKKAAQRARLVDELRISGYRVLQDDEARDHCTADGRDLRPFLVRLDAQVPGHLGDSSLKVSDVLDRAKVPRSDMLAIDHPNAATPPVVAVGTGVLEGALRRIKAHREQLEKRAEKASRATPQPPAPAPAPPAPPPSPEAADPAADGPAVNDAREDFVRSLVSFTTPPHIYAPKAAGMLPQIAVEEERRVFRVLAAAEVGACMQRDGGEGLPPHKLGQMLCVLLSWDDGALSLSQAAYLAGVPWPFAAVQDAFISSSRFKDLQRWLWDLPDEHAARMAMVLLAAEDYRGDSPMDEFPEAVLSALDIPAAGLMATAKARVHEIIQLGAAEHGQQVPPKPTKAGKAAKAAKAAAKPNPGYRYRNAATGETWSGRGLQPRWLKAALEGGATLAQFDLQAGGGL